MNHITILILAIFASTSATKMSTCTHSSGQYPLNVSYSINSYVCEKTPCTCTLGCASTISYEFQAPRYLEKIKPNIHAASMGVELDYPLGQNDACVGFTNTQCPIVKNEKVNYQYSLTIPAIFPEVTVTLRVSLIDEEANEDVVCFEFDILVKKGNCPK